MEKMIDLSVLTLDDLRDEYAKLFVKLKECKDASETDAQRIHELRRSLETANAAEAYLTQELEQLTQYHEEILEKGTQKLRKEYETLRRSHNEILKDHSTLQAEYESIKTVNNELIAKLSCVTSKDDEPTVAKVSAEQLQRENLLEQENMELMAKIDESQDNIVKYTMALAERENKISILKDEVMCLEENLKVKKEELEEKTQHLESAQDQVTEANSKIALLTSAPENSDRKGNSLFAEVDDQRQAMKQLLMIQKNNFLQMKKVYNESQYEIRRLKRENIAMHNELQACTTVFCNADKKYKQKLNDRINELLRENENLEKKLTFTCQCLTDLATKKEVLWLDSMLTFCKQETEELRKQLFSARIENSSLEEQLRKSQQEMAKWRFETLKLRCILIDRENLLNENDIKFRNFASNDIKIGEEELKNASPRIIDNKLNDDTRFTKTIKKIKKETNKENVQSEIGEEELKNASPRIIDNKLNDDTSFTKKIKKETNKENAQSEILLSDKKTITPDENLDKKMEDILKNSAESENKETLNTVNTNAHGDTGDEYKANLSEPIELIKVRSTMVKNTKVKSHIPLTPDLITKTEDNEKKEIPSILISKRDVFKTDNEKSVQFASSTNSNSSASTRTVIKQARNNSNVIIRHYIVGSKCKK